MGFYREEMEAGQPHCGLTARPGSPASDNRQPVWCVSLSLLSFPVYFRYPGDRDYSYRDKTKTSEKHPGLIERGRALEKTDMG